MRIDELRPVDILGLKSKKWVNIEELRDHLESIGAQPIGTEGAAEVFAHKELGNLVLRVSEYDDLGWAAWAEYCKLNQGSNPHCMRVTKIIRNDNWYFCVLERLKFDRDKVQYLAKQHYRMYGRTSREFKWAIADDIETWHQGILPDRLENFIEANGGRPLGQALWDIGTMSDSKNSSIDLHFGNWGFRGDTLVITDPLA